MGTIFDLVKGKLVFSELNQHLMLQLDPPGKTLPDGANFDTSFAIVLDNVTSNVLPLSSIL